MSAHAPAPPPARRSAAQASPRRRVDAAAPELLATAFESSLQPRQWSLATAVAAPALARVIHLASGQGTLRHGEDEWRLRAGDVVWLPAGRAHTLRVEAGSAGIWVGVADTLLASALGERSDAAVLRAVALRSLRAGDTEPLQRQELVRSLHAMEVESRLAQGSSRPYLVAHLTLVLVLLWRLSSGEHDAEPGLPAPQRLLQFRHLVEAQFRSHWPLARYAAELGISPDRLHDLCVRALGRPPLELLHQRLLREACSLLAGTDLPVERVALELGFTGSSAFSRFFRRGLRHSPSAWRAAVRAQAAAGPAAAAPNYADWP